MKKIKVALLSLLTLLTGCKSPENGIKKAGTLVTSSKTSSLKLEISFKGNNYNFSAKGFVVGTKNNQVNIDYKIENKTWTLENEFEFEAKDSVAPDRYTVVYLNDLECNKIQPLYTTDFKAYFIRLYNDFDKVDTGLYSFVATDKKIESNNVVSLFDSGSVKLTQV